MVTIVLPSLGHALAFWRLLLLLTTSPADDEKLFREAGRSNCRKMPEHRAPPLPFWKEEEYKNLPHANLKTPVVNLTSTWAQVHITYDTY